MRPAIIIAVLVVLAAIVAVATGFVNLSGESGRLPDVAVTGGDMPSVKADVGQIDVGTTRESVELPKVEIGTAKETVKLPTVEVKKANEE